jgi:Tol biopolymer transport system component
VISLVLSPDNRYLAIDGTHNDNEQLWMFNTRTMSLKREPTGACGTFLHWFPNNSDNFLYRAIFPSGPSATLNTADWNPGLWIGNAILGTFSDLGIGQPATDLVDALVSPDGAHILYSTSRGLGMGSDIWTTDLHGRHRAHLLHLSNGAQRIAGMFSWSPDGQKIAYERLSDSPTPFLPASLWVMDRQGHHQRMLAQADGGHGFALRWSPDSNKVAFVARANPNFSGADQNVQALQSSVNVVEVANGHVLQIASPAQTGMQINASPAWSANGKQLTFAAYNPLNPRLGGTVHYWSAQVQPTGVRPSLAQVSPAITRVIALG